MAVYYGDVVVVLLEKSLELALDAETPPSVICQLPLCLLAPLDFQSEHRFEVGNHLALVLREDGGVGGVGGGAGEGEICSRSHQ